jgi:predicted metalloprotease with PDZ domain
MRLRALILCASLLAGAAGAQSPSKSPELAAMPAALPKVRDIAYPGGTIELEVDATDVARAIFSVHERVPLKAGGPITLLYPQWLPGDHSPSGQIAKLAGLTATVDGKPVAWMRDPVEVFAFHVDAPAGAKALDLSFQFVSATAGDQGPIVMTPTGMQLEWNSMLLYPAGHYATRIMFAPKLKLPPGWGYATALGYGTAGDGPIAFPAVDLSTLVDSPLFAGKHFKRIDLDPGGRSPVFLNMIGDTAKSLEASEEQLKAHRSLVKQADLLFGSRHFDHYDFLFSLSDALEGVGLEHHRSSENGVGKDYFSDWSGSVYDHDLLPHEMTHSWNGKYRRPYDLWTPNFNTPMRDSLLWMYEGQTQYWGQVLAARAGLVTREEALGALARVAALYDLRPGRKWKPLIDTTNDPIVANRAPAAWRSWQRSEDYYEEGQLIWLEADTLIREKTGGAKSLDDFAKLFLGGRDGEWAPATYRRADIVAALNSVAPNDWAGFLHTRIDLTTEHAPLDGLARGGYKLAYSETPSAYQKAIDGRLKGAELLFSIGLNVGEDGRIREVMWDGPAFNQGLTVGTRIVAVNGEAYNGDTLKQAITDAKTARSAIDLLVQAGDRYRTVGVDYHGGLRYPVLERIADRPDVLGAILSPR